jgi:hypothetical protein
LIHHRTPEVLKLGGDREEAPRGLQRIMSRHDVSGLDNYTLENIESIQSRGLDDAFKGRPPCPLWGLGSHDEPDQA